MHFSPSLYQIGLAVGLVSLSAFFIGLMLTTETETVTERIPVWDNGQPQFNEETGTTGLPTGALLTADARTKLVAMAKGMGIQGSDTQIADWIAQMAGGKTAEQWRTGAIRGSGKAKTVTRPKNKGVNPAKGSAVPGMPGIYKDKNGRRYRVGARGGKIYID